MISQWQIETVLRENATVKEGYKLVITEDKFSTVCREIYTLLSAGKEEA